MTRDPRVQRVVDYFERLTPASLATLGSVYHDDARFVDPFNDVVGHAAIRRVFEHMYASLDEPRFDITETIAQDDRCCVLWDFRFRLRGRHVCVRGASHLRFAADGRVALHRDYWDPARELYEQLPLLGVAVRWLRRRLSAG